MREHSGPCTWDKANPANGPCSICDDIENKEIFGDNFAASAYMRALNRNAKMFATLERNMLDNAVMATFQMIRARLLTAAAHRRRMMAAIRRENDFINAKGDKPMAKRKTKAKRRVTMRLKVQPIPTGPYIDPWQKDEAPEAAPTQQLPTDTETVAMFVAAYLLDCLGFRPNEIGELFGCSSDGAMERVDTGRVIAARCNVNPYHLTARNRAMRENAWADGARKAAAAMQERIALALPAFIRTAENGKVGNRHGIAAVVAMVNTFMPEDVVTVSPEAQTVQKQYAESNERPRVDVGRPYPTDYGHATDTQKRNWDKTAKAHDAPSAVLNKFGGSPNY